MNAEERALVEDFQKEALSLIEKMNLILEQCEGDIRLAPGLEEYGQLVDRIMGGSQSLVVGVHPGSHVIPVLEQIGNYSSVCKAVGYKTSQLKERPEFYEICVAFLMDATEVLEDMANGILEDDSKYSFDQTFIDRLKWVNSQFGDEYRSSVAVKETNSEGRMNQFEIDELLKKLGLN